MNKGHRSVLRELWAVKTFRAFWLAGTLSNLGTSAYLMAMTWLTVRLYGSHGIALLALGYGLPQLLLELFGGAATDRTPRRKLYGLTESSLCLLAAVLWLASIHGAVPLGLLVTVSVGNGVISAFDTPARSALISEMVPSKDVVSAQQIFSVSAQIASIFGPALGGFLMSSGGHGASNESLPFLLNFCSYIPVIVCIPFLPRVERRAPLERQHLRMQDVVRGVREGLVYVGSNRALVILMKLLAVLMLLGGPFQSLLPIYVHDSSALAADHRAYAILLSAVGLGGFLGSLAGVASAEERQRFQALAIAALGLGCSLLLLTASRAIHWAVLSAFLAGIFNIFAINLDLALMLGFTPPQMQGRVTSIASLGKGLQSVTAGAASEAIGQLIHSPWKGEAFTLVQGGLAVALMVCAVRFWRPLSRLAVQAGSPGSGPEPLGG